MRSHVFDFVDDGSDGLVFVFEDLCDEVLVGVILFAEVEMYYTKVNVCLDHERAEGSLTDVAHLSEALGYVPKYIFRQNRCNDIG